MSAFVVIRTCGERTCEVAAKIISDNFGYNNIETVSEEPFEAALRKTYKIGITCGKKWLVTLDADIFLLPAAIERLVEIADKMPEHYFQAQGRIFDKVFGSYREAGSRVCRVSLLEKALQNMPATGSEIRPEAATLKRMGVLGHPSRRVGLVTGIHDFEQYYADLYRKAFVHGQKHDYLAADLLRRCLRKKDSDPDFAVILRGFCDGIGSLEKATIDAGRFREQAQRAMRELGLEEKASLNPVSIGDWNAWVVSQLEFEPTAYTDHDLPRPPKVHPSAGERFREILNDQGLLFALRYAAGATLVKFGRSLKQA
jgi:hypothetical protein